MALLVGFHPATQSVQSTPADNAREGVRQYIEKEKRKKERVLNSFYVLKVKVSSFENFMRISSYIHTQPK